MLHLNTSWGIKLENPSEYEITETLQSMPGGENSFVILEKGANEFIQAAGGESEEIVMVEYQDGGPELHFRVTGAVIDLQTTIELFQSYARGDDDWRIRVGWSPVRLPGVHSGQKAVSPPSRRTVLLILGAILGLGFLAAVILPSIPSLERTSPFLPIFIAIILTLIPGVYLLNTISAQKQADEIEFLLKYGLSVEGRIINLKRQYMHKGDESRQIVYSILCRLATGQGDRTRAFFVDSPWPFSIGDKVTVRYNPEKPQSADWLTQSVCRSGRTGQNFHRLVLRLQTALGHQ